MSSSLRNRYREILIYHKADHIITIQVLYFYGNVNVRVLGGVVNMESYALRSCDRPVNVCVPKLSSQPAICLAPMDTTYTVSLNP